MLAPWKKSYDKPRQNIKKQKHYFANVRLVKAMVFPVVMYECESWTIKKNWWALKNWCLWTVVLKKALESPLDCKEIKPVNPNGNQSRIFIGRTDAESEAPNLATRCEELTHWKRPWCWGRLKAGERGNRGWDGWLTPPTQRTWVWANSVRQWKTGKPGIL